MKKLLLLAGVFALIMSSCTQELPVADKDLEQEVVFTQAIDMKGMKAGNEDDPFLCDNAAPDYALVVLALDGVNQEPIEVPVFTVNDILYTQAIKLPPGSYQLVEFLLYASVEGDDILVNAAPHSDNQYGQLVSNALPLDVTVSPFAKTEIPVSILCYTPGTYENFGFTWFRIENNYLRNKFFFGDFCTKFFEDYDVEGSLYHNSGVVLVDMPAIFSLDLFVFDGTDWVLVDQFDNSTSFNSGAPLEIIYPDMLAVGDRFRLDISIYVKTGATFDFVNFGSWYWEDSDDDMYTDEAMTEHVFGSGTDGVYDFILGNCNVNGADFMFAPYMNLPAPGTSGITMTVDFPSTTAYFDITLAGIGAGFDLTNGTVDGYCFDLANQISAGGTTYSIDIYSSLYPNSLPSYMQNENWGAVNWLANNYKSFTGWTWQDLQLALWVLENNTLTSYTGGAFQGVTGDVARVADMVASALLNPDYQPMPGGWAAVVLEHEEGTQTIFTIVDP